MRNVRNQASSTSSRMHHIYLCESDALSCSSILHPTPKPLTTHRRVRSKIAARGAVDFMTDCCHPFAARLRKKLGVTT